MPVIRSFGALAACVLLSPSAALAAGPTKEACVAANEAAQDLRQAGKLREARQKLLVCVSDACPGPVREDCVQRLNDVNTAMPTIVFEVKDPSGNDVSAARVSMDGQPLVDRVTGGAVSIDPGEHRFAFDDANGVSHAEQTVVVREGDHDRRIRAVLRAAGTETSTSAVSTPTEGSQPGTPAPIPAGSTNVGGTQRLIGLVVGGTGVAGLVVGSIFGLVSKSTYDHAFGTECRSPPTGCSTQGAADGQTAHTQAMVSTVGFIAGGVLLAGGAVLYFTAPSGDSVAVAPAIGSDGAGLALRGLW
jgi:hypothetical protein